MLPRRALASNLDALSDAWDWGPDDVVAHGLPLFHVHGLILGDARAAAARAAARGTSGASPPRPPAAALGGARDDALRRADDVPPAGRGPRGVVLAGFGRRSGPAARLGLGGLAGARSRADLRRLRAAAGRALRDERDADEHGDPGRRRPAAGHRRRAAWTGVSVRLVDDSGAELDVSDDSTVGEIQVRGPNLFLEYLNRPDATADAMRFRLVRDRRRRDPFRGRLHPDRRAARDRPDQERRLQDRGGGDRERAARASRRGRGGGHRRARRRPRRAHRRLGRGRGRCVAPRRARAGRPRRRRCSRPTSGRASSATWTSSRATPWARSPRRPWGVTEADQAARLRADHPGENAGQAHLSDRRRRRRRRDRGDARHRRPAPARRRAPRAPRGASSPSRPTPTASTRCEWQATAQRRVPLGVQAEGKAVA